MKVEESEELNTKRTKNTKLHKGGNTLAEAPSRKA